ncbi:MAG: hypothetical protein K2M78_02840 [Lachnospiraceae bacterium]|nr:hypothetical protein [Lachnospiraceae bacterium]
MKALKGSITIFLTLIFTLVLALVCILLESVRISSAVTKAEGITYMGLDSCFAGYGRELFEEYGVLFLWNTEDQFINTYEKITGYNCNITDDLRTKGMDIYGLKLNDVRINQIKYCTDNDGEIFEKQVYEYMLHKLGADAINKLLEKTKVLSQGDKVSGFYNEITSCEKIFSKAENAVVDIKSEINNIKNIEGNPSNNISSIIEKSREMASTDSEQYILSLKEQMRVEYGNYNRWSEEMGNSLTGIGKNIDDYKKYVEEAKEEAQKLSKKIEQQDKELDKDIYDVMQQEVKDIENKFNEQDGYGIDACKKEADRLYESLSKMNTAVDKLVSGNMADDSEAEDILKISYDFNVSGLSINIMESETEKSDNIIKDKVDNMMKKGILNLVTDSTDKISNREVDLSKLPSVSGENNGSCWTQYNMLEGALRKAVFGEYVLTHFGCYTDLRDNTPLEYEVEYIIEGNSRDNENLKAVVGKIIAIRSGFNMISIFKDSEKRNETYILASSVAGVTGMPLVVKIVQIGIVSAWSAAESVADVKNLLSGKKVALIKSPSQWNLSLDNIINADKTKKEEDDKGGLSYQDYLRYLLSMQNKALQVNRTMDVIQLFICKNYNKDFKMSECISSISITSDYQIKRLFALFVPIGKKKDAYDIKISQRYEY